MKTCVINYACDGREPYEAGQDRLRASLMDSGYKGDVLFYRGKDLPPNSPPHEIVSHAFKVYAFTEAFKRGYEGVLWLDSSVVVRQPLEGVLDVLDRTGSFFILNNGCTMAQWAGERQLESLGCTVQEAESITLCRSGVVGLTPEPFGQTIIRDMVELVHKDGGVAYNGSDESSSPNFVAHRHDQVVFSWFVHKYQLSMWSRVALYTNESYIEGATFEFKSMGGLNVQSTG